MYWVYVLKNNENRTYTGHTGQFFSRVKNIKMDCRIGQVGLKGGMLFTMKNSKQEVKQ
jgi:hypothetical protein